MVSHISKDYLIHFTEFYPVMVWQQCSVQVCTICRIQILQEEIMSCSCDHGMMAAYNLRMQYGFVLSLLASYPEAVSFYIMVVLCKIWQIIIISILVLEQFHNKISYLYIIQNY